MEGRHACAVAVVSFHPLPPPPTCMHDARHTRTCPRVNNRATTSNITVRSMLVCVWKGAWCPCCVCVRCAWGVENEVNRQGWGKRNLIDECVWTEMEEGGQSKRGTTARVRALVASLPHDTLAPGVCKGPAAGCP